MDATSGPSDPGDVMTMFTSSETARIEALLSRLDPEPQDPCQVAGCLHVHHSPDSREGVTALAA
jgi:hypothetical protein